MKASLKRNLLIGFGLSLLLLIISSVASFVSIAKMSDSAGWVDHTNKVIIQTENVISYLKDAETGQRGYLLTGKSDYLDPYVNAKGKAMLALDSVRALTLDNKEQTKSCDDLKAILIKRADVLQRSIDHRQERNIIDTALLDTGKMYMDQVRGIINEMESRERGLLAQRTGSLESDTTITRIIIAIAALLSILITIFFYARVTTDFEQKERLRKELEAKDADITRRINIIQGIAERISGGDYRIRAVDEGRDGLGGLAYSVNKMAGSLDYSFNLLSDKEWTQTGIAGLNDIMLGEKDIEPLTKDIIDFLAGYTNSSVGTLYLKENAGQLKLYSGYAYAVTEKRRYINIGDGLAGQAVAAGKEILVKDIPKENIYISYAAGEIKPVEVIAMPVFDGHVIKGVVELGKIKSFTDREIEFLKAVSHNIGIAVNSTQNRKKLQELLEETQAQSEELQAQHSELEGLNTELEMQTQKLQASDEELRVQQEELMQANQELEERTRLVEEKNQLIVQRNIEIQAKAEELALSTKYKSEFLAKMSHELRTPLNSILLLSRLLSENNEQNLSGDQVEYARVIQSSGKGLLSLIDEILDLSKIESGKMDLEYGGVSLREISNDMNTLFKPVATEKNIELNIHVEEDVPAQIETDKLRLEQIIRNLLSNALKFTSKGFVSLNIANTFDKKDHITITVKDTGIGIPKDKQQLIFEAFQQADGSTRRRYGGTGLGLSISRQLAKLLKGDIELTSTEGKGSEFVLTIPTSKKAANTVTAVNGEEEEETGYEKPILTSVDNPYITTLIPENIPDDRGDIKVTDKTILIIEDDTNFAKSLQDFSHTRGYKAIVAVRGDEGIELAKKFRPLGILLDVQLPVKSGWDVMDELKSDPQTRHIPVHIMSSHEVRKESLLKGAVDFINKPMAFEQVQEVFEKIEYVLARDAKKVLIVEENTKHAKALAYFLETYNISTEVKESVPGGIESLQKETVDCVILDMGIPGQKSYETLDAVKKTAGLEHLPIIIFTGKSLSQAEEMRIKQYADSIVVKTAHSYQRILDEVSIFLHLVEENNKKTAAPTNSGQKKLGALNQVLKNKTVLIADDDIRNIFSLTKSLEKYEMNVLTAVDGKDAINQLKENPAVDVILMDMMMPEMDGYETTAKIKRIPSLKNIPVIAVTAKAMTGDREKCLSSGASDYITKPIDIDQLLSLLRVWLYEKSIK